MQNLATHAPALNALLRRLDVRRRARTRLGFTLIELMMVVVIIGMLAAILAPSMVRLIRDQRSRRDAMTVVNLYRDAKSRSLGRGAATFVTYRAATRDIVVQELVTTAGVPQNRCLLPAALPAGLVLRDIFEFDLSPAADMSFDFQVSDGSALSTPASNVTVCYSPKGRTMMDTGGGFIPASANRIEMTFQTLEGSDTLGVERRVLVGPGDLVRMRL